MIQNTQNIQAQFAGFFSTPHLFKKHIFGMTPFLKTPKSTIVFNAEVKSRIRLGQRVERFVSEELKALINCSILSENHQVKRKDNQTIGELDCLFSDQEKPVHLEIQFKYYLYDESLGETEIDHCIGPMRRDTLNEKLSKLKTKQLPLLYAPETKPFLDSLNLKSDSIQQQIYFKAQLFLPYGKTIKLKTLNNDCVYGFYFNYSQLNTFKECKFYKPCKVDWLLDVTPQVNWQTYEQILPQLKVFQAEAYSPLLWLKFPNGEIAKCFVVAW